MVILHYIKKLSGFQPRPLKLLIAQRKTLKLRVARRKTLYRTPNVRVLQLCFEVLEGDKKQNKTRNSVRVRKTVF